MRKFWDWLFSGNQDGEVVMMPNVDPNGPEETLQKTSNLVQNMEMKCKKLEYEILKLRKEAKEAYQSKNETRAKSLLKKCRQKEMIYRQLQGQLDNVQQIEMTMESSHTAAEIATLMDESIGVMSAQMRGLNVDDINLIRDDFAEVQESIGEINNILADPISSYNNDNDNDMMSIDEQMKEWEDEIATKESDNAVEMMPTAPTRRVKQVDNDNNNNNNPENPVEDK